MMMASFAAFLIGFLLIGLVSVLKSRGTKSDYYLASRSVPPALAGLSAVATNNSGYMFIGVIGFTYATGLAAIWLMVGWIVGDFLASLFIHRQLRLSTERTREVTFAGVLSRWQGGDFSYLRKTAALATVLFLGAYAAAQLAAGGKALQALFDWQRETGAIIVALMVALYCLAGGIRASIWTDAAQALVMVVAMGLLFIVAVADLGGINAAWQQLANVPHYLEWFPSDLAVPGVSGMALFVTGWLFAGFSVIGQPHIMVRFMALDRADHIRQARFYYYGFFAVFYALATGVGLLSRLYLPDLHNLDPELALPRIARMLLPPVFVGMILAGIFAATMSTADSLVLACSSALTHDLLPRRLEKTWEIKTATMAVTLLALAIALADTQSVFSLVILAWSTLASAFGPLLLVLALGRPVEEWLALAMMAVGTATAWTWRHFGLHADIYEGMPGMLAGLGVYAALCRVRGASFKTSRLADR
ncbi:MAG: sodium/proline symporter [Alphaproteobacteria bacterium]|nr:MAG: sodium/proline symporter [Alphaproteobacteria bacterium]